MKQKFCLNSVASFTDINKSSLNNSKTKQTFSFSKTSRFEQNKPTCDQLTYGGDFIMHKTHGTGIGYGRRSDFTKSPEDTPSCHQYKVPSTFEQNQNKKRGYSLALSREAVCFNQYINKQSFGVPVSTKYQTEKYDKFRSPSYSIRKRTRILDRSVTLDPEVQNPGPGYYNYKNAKFSETAYSSSKERRFFSSETAVPPVGQYNISQNISNVGKYINSKHQGGTQAKFSKSSRTTFLDEAQRVQKQKPGPGYYKAPSEFGQYDGNVYGSGTALGRFSRKN